MGVNTGNTSLSTYAHVQPPRSAGTETILLSANWVSRDGTPNLRGVATLLALGDFFRGKSCHRLPLKCYRGNKILGFTVLMESRTESLGIRSRPGRWRRIPGRTGRFHELVPLVIRRDNLDRTEYRLSRSFILPPRSLLRCVLVSHLSHLSSLVQSISRMRTVNVADV